MSPSIVLFGMSFLLVGQSKYTGWKFVFTSLLLLAGAAVFGWQFVHHWEGFTEPFFQLLLDCALGTLVGLGLGKKYAGE